MTSSLKNIAASAVAARLLARTRLISQTTLHTSCLLAPCTSFSDLAHQQTSSNKNDQTGSNSSITFPAIPKSASEALKSINNQNISSSEAIPDHTHVKAAMKRISSIVSKTPLDFSPRISNIIGKGIQLHFKKEHASLTGSYKERGACNKLLQLTQEERDRGCICASQGNHAQAFSLHTTRLGIDGLVVMPITAPLPKVESTKEFGAKILLHGNSFAEATEEALRIAEREKRTFIHAFNDYHTIAGQGTVAIEILGQNPEVDTIVVPIGGGGLISGMAAFLRNVNPRIKIIGVEAATMDGMKRSVAAGKVETVPYQYTMADGIAVSTIGSRCLATLQKYPVDEIVTVTEDDMASAVLMLLEKERTVCEASGAASLAAVLGGRIKDEYIRDKNVVCILSGGNISMALMSRIIEKGLVVSGRLARIHVRVKDEPGQLAQVADIVSGCRGNIRNVEHVRAFLLSQGVGLTQNILEVETKNHAHVHEIAEALKRGGFTNVRIETPTE